MEWEWRGDYVPATSHDYRRTKEQLESETNGKQVPFADLPFAEQVSKLKGRLKEYSRKAYKKTHITKNIVRSDTVCMRENSFYVDTVRDFRDRRYIYKGEHKVWKGRHDKAQDQIEAQQCAEMVVLYESLQLAHKCILNSFYGYVMRKGARWYSMETAGIVTYTGAKIIREARLVVEKIGRPLELDTDGIWCILPSSFPQNFTFTTSNPKKREFFFSYPIMLLNTKVADKFTNDQYQTLSKTTPKVYDVKSECSILFEMDGPYKAIVLPASREQDVKLKKRYAVFHKNGTLAELKGFEMKRRGELKLVKDFQEQVFDKFLRGSTLEETYASVAQVANHYLDILDSKGSGMEDDELITLITESSKMSRALSDYEKQRSCAITTAKRLADLLGDQSVIKGKGLACSFIIAKRPTGAIVTDRAIPVSVFSTDATTRRRFLAQWLKTSTVTSLRDIVDWDYYRDRLANSVQKIITIPAALQKVANPVPRIPYPEWLTKSMRTAASQRNIDDIFRRVDPSTLQNAPVIPVPDMEDVAGKPMRTARPVSHSRKRGRQEMETEEPIRPTGESPDPLKDYEAFLDHQKALWKYQREMRKRNRSAPDTGPSTHENPRTRGAPSSITSYISAHTKTIIKSDWHLIQIKPAGAPGVFVVWALANESLFKFHLSVPRTYYINFRVAPAQNSEGVKITTIPPRSKGHQHMYKYTTNEAQYQEDAKELALQFTHPSIEGVYERSVPLLWRPLIELGCTCRLTFSASKGGLRDTYSLENLTPSTHTNFTKPAMGYLDKDNVKHIYVYHSSSEGRGAMFAVVRPYQSKGTIIIVNAHTAQGEKKTLLQPLAEKYPTIEFEFDRAKAINEGYKKLQDLLAELARGRGITVMLLQSHISGAHLAKNVPALDSFPYVNIPANAADNEYPALDWEKKTTQALAHRFASVNGWWDHILALARYANLPVGNLDGDLTLLTSDISFARELKQNNHLLWMSPSNLPDLGGSEEDDAVFAEELVNPELNEPGFYRPFCIEFEVFNLAFNTVLAVSRIGDIEGSGSIAFEEDNASKGVDGAAPKSYDQSSTCTSEFKILRKLVSRWAADLEGVNPTTDWADGLITQFYRWVSTPHALLYDPAIHKLIHDLMKKVFLQLVAEFRRFGAKIIFANYNKIIIGTTKVTLEDAKVFSDNIYSVIKQKALFAWLSIRPVKYWENLLWMDRANYGGAENMTDMNIESKWNIVEYLPKTIQTYFQLTIGQFFIETQKAGPSSTKGDDINEPEERASEVVNNLSQRLFATIQDIQRTLSGDHSQAESSEFPKLAGSHLTMNNPALEFIKFVCHVLSLDKTLEHDVNRLKKNLLRLINIGEFADEASFVNPCLSYVLPDVMCEYCNYVRDLDLLRDASTLPAASSTSRAPTFACKCKHPFNRNHMEAMLVEIVQKRDLAYQLQDLVCGKCNGVKASNMVDNCSNCSGKWVCKIPLHAFKQSMVVFRNIAEFYKFDWLLEVVNTCISLDS